MRRSIEPCMCGAIDCSVCGPLQGYHKCQTCGSWECQDETHGEPQDFFNDDWDEYYLEEDKKIARK